MLENFVDYSNAFNGLIDLILMGLSFWAIYKSVSLVGIDFIKDSMYVDKPGKPSSTRIKTYGAFLLASILTLCGLFSNNYNIDITFIAVLLGYGFFEATRKDVKDNRDAKNAGPQA